MHTPLISLKGIVKTYRNEAGETPVLRGLNLAIREGEFVALMGPSGSGKSTLMHILGFLDRPTSGVYMFGERDVSRLDDTQLAHMRRDNVGFVFQAFNLLSKTTALENVQLPLTYTDVSDKERVTRAEAALAAVGLSNRSGYLPSQLSGGQRQRVAIARALINNPFVIFADEPTGNLDSQSSDQVMELLGKLHAEGKTIVMVTHEADIAAHASRRIRMKDGNIIDG